MNILSARAGPKSLVDEEEVYRVIGGCLPVLSPPLTIPTKPQATVAQKVSGDRSISQGLYKVKTFTTSRGNATALILVQ
ncbi:MAG: hypothetical protein H0Z40_07445 [Desulfotomaculum sp.]|nr:hypothetical protein [Desulfotomaculum sp.]